MVKRFISFLFSLMFSIFTCNAIEIEVFQQGLSYILNTSTNKAKLFKIYVGLGEVKDVIVPSTVEYDSKTYVVTEVLGQAIERNPDGISSIELPSTLENTKANRETLGLISKFHIPVYRAITNIENFFNGTLKKNRSRNQMLVYGGQSF